MQSLSAIIVRFPHGAESVPAFIRGRPVRFATIDEDGALIAWATDQAPVLDEDMGAWIADTEFDLATVRTVGDGNEYPMFARSMSSISFH